VLGQAQSFGISAGAPFYFYNVFEELDQPGEYYIDRENGVLYLYPPQEPGQTEIMLSVLRENVIRVQNGAYLTFKDFSVCGTRTDGVSLQGKNLMLDGCKVYNTRKGAVTINGSMITVHNCEITGTGSFGIHADGGDVQTLTESGNLIFNNYIHDWADVERTYQPGIQLAGCGHKASHNEICHAPHQAVAWEGNKHVMEYNDVYHVCYETSDCSAFYSGRSYSWYGNVIRYNYIHEVGAGTVFAHGIYWDDCLSGQTAYGNIVQNTAHWGMLIGGGRDNVVENNIFINCRNNPIRYDQRGRNWELMGMKDQSYLAPNATVRNRLRQVPYESEIWRKTYPQLAAFKIEESPQDMEDPYVMVNPSFSVIRGNASYGPEEEGTVYPSRHVRNFSEVSGNEWISEDLSDFTDPEKGDFTLKKDAELFKKIPGFCEIPVQEIGRIKPVK